MLSKRVLYYGKDEPLPERIPLRAGPLALFYEGGDLRSIKLGEHEVLRRIYVAIRDRNWGTILPQFSNVKMDAGEQTFRISFDVENHQGDINFAWKGLITGEADGTIRFSMDGTAHTSFLRNRIGFCVLHPAGAAGERAVVHHVDGSTEEGRFPELIVAGQPVQPFAEMEGMAHEVAPGVWAEVSFTGDIFEMEDQRNWTDASYKTFCTPLRLPYPVEIYAGTRVNQSVTLRLRDEGGLRAAAGAAEAAGPAPVSVTVEAGQAAPLPPIGLGAASHRRPLSEQELRRLRALRPAHLRVDLQPSDVQGTRQALAAAQAAAQGLSAALHVGLLLSANLEAELDTVEKLLAELRPQVAAWMVFPVKEIFAGGSPTRAVAAAARQRLEGYHPAARWGAGTNTDFIFLQRTPPPAELLDFITFSINPQVHAFDNASIVETLAAQAAAVRSARRYALAGERELPVHVSPVTLKPRSNPYATAPMPKTLPGEMPPQADARQMSLLGAGWTLGSLKYLAEAGADALTYFETTGLRGVMETEAGSEAPRHFHSLPGGVFPLYHVLADAAEFAGGEALLARSSDCLRVECLALRNGDRLALLLANFTDEPQRVAVQAPLAQASARRLDETNAEEAMLRPEQYRSRSGETITAEGGRLQVELLPYGVMRLDGQV